MAGRKAIEVSDVPVLPRFPSEAFDIVVTFTDGSVEIVKVMARGKAAAIQTASYAMAKWPDEKIPNIVTVSFK
jgi:hypothetical protein